MTDNEWLRMLIRMAILRINLKDEVPARQTRAMQGLLKLVVGVDYIKKAKDMWGDGYDALKFEYLSILRTNIETGSEYKSEPPIIEELKERPDKEVWTDMVNWLIMISKCTVIDESVLMDRPKRPLNDISMENMYKNQCYPNHPPFSGHDHKRNGGRPYCLPRSKTKRNRTELK